MNKRFSLGLSIQEISEIVMYEFWFDYEKLKYGEIGKLGYMDTDNFLICIKKKAFRQILQKMLKRDLMVQIAN